MTHYFYLLLVTFFVLFLEACSASSNSTLGSFSVVRDHTLTIKSYSELNNVVNTKNLQKRDFEEMAGPFVLYFDTGNYSFVFDLDFNRDLFAAGVPEGVEPKRHFAGRVRGFADSSVYLTLLEGYYEGVFSYFNDTDTKGDLKLHTMWVQRLKNPEKLLKLYNVSDSNMTTAAASSPMMIVYSEDELPTVDSDQKVGCGMEHNHLAKRDISLISEQVRSLQEHKKKLEKRAVTLEGASGQWTGRTCLMSLLADPLYYAQYGSSTADIMISRIAVASQVYKATFNVSLAVNNIQILTSFSEKPWWSSSPSSISSYLNQFTSVANQGLLNWDTTHFCIGHAFTYQDFAVNSDGSQPLGLAWVANLCSVIPSSSSSGSFSVSTGKSLLLDPLAVQAYTMSHEFGHNFGSDHDGVHSINGYNENELGQCAGSNPYIMIAYSSPYSSNSHVLSTCSRWLIEKYLNQLFNGEVTPVTNVKGNCFVDSTTLQLLSIDSTAANYTMPWYSPIDQCGKVSQDPRVPYRSQPWTSCASSSYVSSSLCLLHCTDPDSGDCITFDIGGLKYVADGTVCGWNGTSYLVCMGGTCGTDTYTVCDRRKDCCDSFGQYRPSTYRCRNTTDPDNVCRQDDFCNPDQVGDKALCPYTASPPKTGCNCEHKWDKRGCTGTCGRNEMYGVCLNSSSLYTVENSTFMSIWGLNKTSMNGSTDNNLCNNKSCTPPSYCLMLDGVPLCQNLTVNSCQLLCDNTASNYSTWGWNCSCSSSCTSNCCSDYKSFCTANLQSSVFDVIPKLLIALYTCGIGVAVVFGVWVTMRERKEEKLRKELSKTKKSAAVVARENYKKQQAKSRTKKMDSPPKNSTNSKIAQDNANGSTPATKLEGNEKGKPTKLVRKS